MMNESTEDNGFAKNIYHESFGDFLKKHREASGKSLDAVSRVTRIPKRFLMAFEENSFKDFPEEAFTRGFLRSYAMDIGLDVDDVISRYDQFKRSQEPTQIKEIKRPESEFADFTAPLALAPKGLVWGGAGLVIACLLAVLLWNLRSTDSQEGESGTEVRVETFVTEPQAAPEVNKDAAPVISSEDAKITMPVNPSILTVTAIRKGKLSLRLDEHPAQDFEFQEGEKRNFNIFKEAELKSADKAAFQFLYNSKPLEVAGPVIKLFNRNRFLGKDSR